MNPAEQSGLSPSAETRQPRLELIYGSGPESKAALISSLQAENTDAIFIAPRVFYATLPEWDGLVIRCGAQRASELVHAECCHLARLCYQRAMQQRRDIILDADDLDWLEPQPGLSSGPHSPGKLQPAGS